MATTSPSSAARLSTPWIFWRDRWDQIDGQTVQSLTDLGEVATARSFWTLYKQNAVDDLPDSCSLHVFKRHVKPEWEDPSNINGGHFRFMSIPSSGTGPQQPEEKFWYSVISGSIGDQFTLSSAINGLGFTNKATRKVISIWLNTTDPAVVVALQREFSQFSQDRFTCKFVAHRTLPRSNFTAHQTCDHRRTKSAPEKYLHLEFDGEESPRASQSPQHQTERANVLDAASDLEDVLLKKRADNTTNSPGGTSNPTTEQLMNLVDHARSKSEGFRQDTVPELRKLRGGTPPPIGETREDLRESGSSGCFPVPTVKAPSPMKVWADQWSPSLLNANQMRPSQPFAPETISALEHQHQQQEAAAQYNAMLQQQQQQVMMAMQQGQPVVFQTPSPTQGGYYAPHHVVVGPPPSQVHVVQYQHTATGGLQFNQGVAPQVPDRSVFGGHHQQQHYHQQNSGHRGNTPPPATRGRGGGRSGEKPHSKSPTPPPQQQQQGKDKPPVEQQQTKSDSPPFVFNGYKFPAGLNRKERRRIMFSGEVDPKTYEGTVFVGENVPNGTCGADGSLPTGETAE